MLHKFKAHIQTMSAEQADLIRQRDAALQSASQVRFRPLWLHEGRQRTRVLK